MVPRCVAGAERSTSEDRLDELILSERFGEVVLIKSAYATYHGTYENIHPSVLQDTSHDRPP